MVLLVIFLIVIIIILLLYIYFYKKEINNITNEITEKKDSNINLRINSLNNDIEILAITINKLYEENLTRNIHLKRRDEELKESIANLSHDLRTPLTSIIGYLQMLKRGNVSEEDKEKYLNIIIKRSNNLNRLIDSFYDLSRIHCDEYKVNLTSLSLQNILCENLALFYRDFTNREIEPVIEIQENLPLVIGDEQFVTRIFSNLITNILNYSKGDSYISLTMENGKILSIFRNKVENFSEEDVGKIFQKFYTRNSSRTENSTGLGLSIVKAFVEKMGYTIEGNLEGEYLSIEICWSK